MTWRYIFTSPGSIPAAEISISAAVICRSTCSEYGRLWSTRRPRLRDMYGTVHVASEPWAHSVSQDRPDAIAAKVHGTVLGFDRPRATLTAMTKSLSGPDMATLRKWAGGRGDHVSAAVDLLAEHDFWFRRQDFISRCVHHAEDGVWINWSEAREAYDAGLRGSGTELAVLDFAIALGEDRFRFSAMGPTNSQALLDAVATALA